MTMRIKKGATGTRVSVFKDGEWHTFELPADDDKARVNHVRQMVVNRWAEMNGHEPLFKDV